MNGAVGGRLPAVSIVLQDCSRGPYLLSFCFVSVAHQTRRGRIPIPVSANKLHQPLLPVSCKRLLATAHNGIASIRGIKLRIGTPGIKLGSTQVTRTRR